jgi:hypothetical protein
MASSFRLTPNIAKGGDTLRCEVQGITKQSDYQGKTFSIQINELDSGKDGGKAGNKNDVLAEFSATIVNTGSKEEPKLAFDRVARTDTLPTDFPIAEVRNSPEGETLSYAPDWKTPHFMLNFATASGSGTSFRILIRGDAGEREGYVYEIGIKVLTSGRIFFDSAKTPTALDCSDFLSHNCVQASKMFMADHQEMVVQRSMGLNYGSDFKKPSLQVDMAGYDLKVTSCIGYQLDAAGMGHAKTMAEADWKKIKSFMVQGKGTTIFKGYEDAGWEGLYYNPDVNHAADRDQEHSYSYSTAKKHSKYYGIKVVDCIINYNPNSIYEDGTDIPPASRTPKESTKVTKLGKVPFGVMLARGGRHTAMILSGRVYEVHYSQGPRDLDLYGSTDFETEWPWYSGIIMVPPGHW